MSNKFFGEKIIAWYNKSKRDLPWRHTQDPYHIWLSEVILQQTRVVQGLPYYERFVAEFPTITDLANAPIQTILRLWQGLGYYSRARNLHHTAQVIVEQWQGQFPSTYKQLLQLKGVGSYTAAAIASFAYNEPVAVVDGNVYRVLARVFGVELDVNSNEGKKHFAQLAQKLLIGHEPAVYNQAIMEFGALQCTPQNPNCMFCPLQNMCVAFNEGKVDKLPIKSNKLKVKTRFFNYLVIEQANKIAMQMRTQNDVWQQLYEFWLIETNILETDFDKLNLPIEIRNLAKQAFITQPIKVYKHILTHQRIEAQFWHIKLLPDINTSDLSIKFYTQQAIENLPKPVLITTYWKEHFS